MFESLKINYDKFYAKRLGTSYLQEVYELQDVVCNNLDEFGHFIKSSKERLQRILSDPNNLCIGIYNKQDELIAYSDLLTHKFITPNYFANDIVAAYDKEDVSLFRAVFVHPNNRGNKLMYDTLKFFIITAFKQNKKIVVSMVHPDNIASLHSLEKAGFSLANKLLVNHEGTNYWRNIMYLQLKSAAAKKIISAVA